MLSIFRERLIKAVKIIYTFDLLKFYKMTLRCARKKDLTSKPCPMEAMALNYLVLRFQVRYIAS